jgi:hypothetical protein
MTAAISSELAEIPHFRYSCSREAPGRTGPIPGPEFAQHQQYQLAQVIAVWRSSVAWLTAC